MKRSNKQQGFTMIELLMVILLVAILGAVALPQFLDFRTEGKVAATQSLVNSIRSGIKLQYSQMILRCSVANGTWPDLAAVSQNDITEGGTQSGAGSCPRTPNITSTEYRFVDQANLPANPFLSGASNNVVADCSSCTDQCSCSAVTAGTNAWCYNASSGSFWAATNNKSECAF